MLKTLCLTVVALAACAGSVQAQLDGSVLTDLTNQVNSFWQQLFDGTSYSPGFLSSLSNLTDLQQKLNIPQTDVNFIQSLLPGNAASEISETVNSALLTGLQLADELEAEFCTPPYIQKGVKYPTECEGPEYIFTISGGYCFIDKETKAVTCIKPQVILEKVAGTCTLKYTSPTTTFVSHSSTLSSFQAMHAVAQQHALLLVLTVSILVSSNNSTSNKPCVKEHVSQLKSAKCFATAYIRTVPVC
ncbi:TPA: hypothetical protein ACH3X1_007888 [Trebouxia sp. C0004]